MIFGAKIQIAIRAVKAVWIFAPKTTFRGLFSSLTYNKVQLKEEFHLAVLEIYRMKNNIPKLGKVRLEYCSVQKLAKWKIKLTSKGIHVCRYSYQKAFDLQVFILAGIRNRRRSILQVVFVWEGIHFEGILTEVTLSEGILYDSLHYSRRAL